jgi:hypothetical protein
MERSSGKPSRQKSPHQESSIKPDEGVLILC